MKDTEMTTKDATKEKKPFTEEMLESINSIADEFDQMSTSCDITPDEIVQLLYKAYEEGFYGSIDAREEAVLTLLREFCTERYNEMKESDSKAKEKEKKKG